MNTSDRELIKQVLAGNQQAYSGLVNRYLKIAGAVAYNVVGDYHHASDVVQEAFLKAYRNLEQLSDHDKFKSWLANIVKTTAIDWRRREKPQILFSQAGSEESSLAQFLTSLSADAPEVAMSQRELEELVHETLAQMPDDYREILILKHMEDLTYQEIADLLDTTINTVESRLFRARNQMKKKFRRVFARER